jgi:hypothetical protein
MEVISKTLFHEGDLSNEMDHGNEETSQVGEERI